MRKDVKLGLAVGGVLLAVLVVYVLVVPGNNANQVGATLETVEGSESQTAGGDNAEEGGASPSQANAPRTETASNGSSDEPAREQTARSGGEASVDAGAAAERGNTGAAAEADRAVGESAGGGWNWDALVNGTEKLPSLGAATDVPSNANALVRGDGSNGGSSSGAGATGIAGNAAQTGSGTTGAGQSVAPSAGATTPESSNATVGGVAQPPAQSPTRQNVLAGEAARADGGTDATTPATPSSAAGARTHVVKAGETYSSISAAVYGSSKHYAQIEAANPGIDPMRLKPGVTIALPAIDARPAAAAVPAAAAQPPQIDPRTEYKVQPNDSLYAISVRLYGKADRMDKIYELNKATIGEDSSRVKPGMVLKLPEPPSQSTAAAAATR